MLFVLLSGFLDPAVTLFYWRIELKMDLSKGVVNVRTYSGSWDSGYTVSPNFELVYTEVNEQF